MSSKFKRLLQLDLPSEQSAFLWWPRQAGKSTHLKHQFPNSAFFDLLNRGLAQELASEPKRFRELIAALHADQRNKQIIINEIQKVPG